MHYSYSFVVAALASQVSAHGLVTMIEGANGVNMPGLTVIDGTPRDCSSNGCGSQADTAIVRTREMGSNRASALGRTQGGGPVSAASAISSFMGTAAGAAGGATTKTATKGAAAAARREANPQLSQLLRRPGQNGGAAVGGNAGGAATAKTESNVAAMAGTGATSGLPTASNDGLVTMTFRQINQDGAGPLNAQIDATSGGTDPAAFKNAQVVQDVPGLGFGGLSAATVQDFPLTVRMPAGMTCEGTVGGAQNVCVVRVQNTALAGPFGGSAAFTQSTAARKRAIEYRLRKRHFARGILGPESSGLKKNKARQLEAMEEEPECE